ncbi:MAG: UDP-N-acetylmuramate dehydrogenase [Anaerolineae bacterium]|jgi:UDP-N-acetylmuramate dehydrogenase
MSEFVDGWDYGGYTPVVTTSWKDRLHQVRRRKQVLNAEITPPESRQPDSRDETEAVTEDREFLSALRARLGAPAVHEHEPLAAHTSLRVGGPADILVVADNMESLRDAVAMAWEHDVPCRVLGAGSNVLVSDRGMPGLVVINRTKAIKFSEQNVRAESGASFSTVAQRCVTRGLAGLEWATGIPGTVGGAVVGNAGAWGSDVASTLHSALIMEPDGTVASWGVERLDYGYRQSALKGAKGPRDVAGSSRQPVVLEATFNLQPGDRHALRARVVEIAARRRASQPSGATCGSVFRNPPGDHAGRLIEAAGLKGEHRGNALISPVHANFIVNLGGASASDILTLIKLAYRSVKEQSGVRLELEIELLGRW